ncbi:hypothetical protein MSG28_001965 [Choristoneura fumiferana]|uniref:Uncharacterized protein n=1 Tax=Choristoneura fumiferana TaxID=7141 RepID=A0ACC0JTP8_CHOFU|nr:hypothetical protein MSG28_001965 [Choristoneura fumiferana]
MSPAPTVRNRGALATDGCRGMLRIRGAQERNVDVEHRFGELGGPAAHVSRGKKKSTRCRMVFRTEIVNAEGQTETLQVCSTQIICTQPPGVPEVCRKSLVSCPATGGLELYLLGKNFLKETRVVFCHRQDGRTVWEDEVVPDKEFLQQTHLVCCVPPYIRSDIIEPVTVQLFVRSGGKASEPHNFQYTPPAHDTGPQHCTRHHTQGKTSTREVAGWAAAAAADSLCSTSGRTWSVADDDSRLVSGGEETRPALVWGAAMLPPRRASAAPEPPLKAEPDDSSQSLPERDEPAPAPAPALLPLEGVDLRLKPEACAPFDALKLSPPARQPSPPSPSPLASFTQQLQAIQTDKMVESVTAAIFNSEDTGGQMYAAPLMGMEPLRRADPRGKLAGGGRARAARLPRAVQPLQRYHQARDGDRPDRAPHRAADRAHGGARRGRHEGHRRHAARRRRRQPGRAGQLARRGPSGGLAPGRPAGGDAPPQDELMLMAELPTAVKTPPAAVKSMILNAAAEILTSDTTMNALVTSAINTANILTEVEQPRPSEPAAEAPLSAMSQAVSQAVTQAVSQAVSHAVSQAVSQEMTVPGSGLTGMSDSDLLSYINPSTFDQGADILFKTRRRATLAHALQRMSVLISPIAFVMLRSRALPVRSPSAAVSVRAMTHATDQGLHDKKKSCAREDLRDVNATLLRRCCNDV